MEKVVTLFFLNSKHSLAPLTDFLKKYFINIFLDIGERREKERERNINMWLPLMHPLLGNLAHNPGMCPDWESNLPPFGSQATSQSTEPHQPGP